MRSQRNKLYYILLLIPFILLTISCGDKESDNEYESKLANLDDSIESKSPLARSMAYDLMREAKDSTSYYEAAIRLAKYYILSPTQDSANIWIKRTEQFAANPNNSRKRAMLAYAYNIEAGRMHYFHKDTDKSIDLYHKAYDLLMQSDEKDQAPNICANLGDAYNFKNQLPDAAGWYRRALFISDSLKLPEKDNVTLYMGLAMIYQQLGDDKRALQLYQQTDKSFNDMPVSMQAYFLNNYGCYYYYLKDYKNSLKQYRRMYNHLVKNKMTDNFDMYLCELNLADIYLNLGDLNKAEDYINKVEPFWKKTGDATAQYYCQSIRLGIATKRGDTNAASNIIYQDKTDEKTILFSMRQIRNKYLRQYYEQRGDWHAAYENLKSDNAENDSLEHNRMNMRATDIVTQYTQDTLQLHNSLRIEHKEAEITTARLWLIVAIASAVVLLMAVIVLILRSHRRKLRLQMQVMQLRLESARNRISPHFVFNVLNNRIVEADNKEADELFDLSKLIRANLDMAGNMTVSLADELDFVDKYVRVEKSLLADDDFTYKVDIDDGIDPKKAMGPSMFIQILVENAFVHAFMGRKGHKVLTISVHRHDKITHVSVLDNGPGFDIRSARNRRRTGLNVIRQTIAVINEQNSKHIQFSLHNKVNDDGTVAGCEATIDIPDGIKYPS